LSVPFCPYHFVRSPMPPPRERGTCRLRKSNSIPLHFTPVCYPLPHMTFKSTSKRLNDTGTEKYHVQSLYQYPRGWSSFPNSIVSYRVIAYFSATLILMMPWTFICYSFVCTFVCLSSHPTSCCSAAEIISTLFFYAMKYKPEKPKDACNDRFVLSKVFTKFVSVNNLLCSWNKDTSQNFDTAVKLNILLYTCL